MWTARALVLLGARRLVLVSRSGRLARESASMREEWEWLCRSEATLETHVCDVSDRPATAALFRRLRDAGLSVRGVFHAAGATHAARVASMTQGDLELALAAKVGGAISLHEASKDDPLAHFVVCVHASPPKASTESKH